MRGQWLFFLCLVHYIAATWLDLVILWYEQRYVLVAWVKDWVRHKVIYVVAEHFEEVWSLVVELVWSLGCATIALVSSTRCHSLIRWLLHLTQVLIDDLHSIIRWEQSWPHSPMHNDSTIPARVHWSHIDQTGTIIYSWTICIWIVRC